MKWTHNGIRLRLSPTLLAVFVIAALLGYAKEISWAMAALLFHEAGHLIAARSVGEPIESLELLPFGAVIKLYERPQTAGRSFLIAAAGPGMSLISATVAAGIVHFFPVCGKILDGFVSASLMLAAVNLLPAVPLDGGRMVRALLQGVLAEKASEVICVALGLALAIGLIVLGISTAIEGTFLPIPFLMALFLIIGGIAELRKDKVPVIAAVSRRSDLTSRDSIRLHTVAIHSSVKARDALKRLKGTSLIAVMDGSMHLLGTLSEGDILNAMILKGSDITLGSIVRRRD